MRWLGRFARRGTAASAAGRARACRAPRATAGCARMRGPRHAPDRRRAKRRDGTRPARPDTTASAKRRRWSRVSSMTSRLPQGTPVCNRNSSLSSRPGALNTTTSDSVPHCSAKRIASSRAARDAAEKSTGTSSRAKGPRLGFTSESPGSDGARWVISNRNVGQAPRRRKRGRGPGTRTRSGGFSCVSLAYLQGNRLAATIANPDGSAVLDLRRRRAWHRRPLPRGRLGDASPSAHLFPTAR